MHEMMRVARVTTTRHGWDSNASSWDRGFLAGVSIASGGKDLASWELLGIQNELYFLDQYAARHGLRK